MSDTTDALRHKLIRNFKDIEKVHEARAPLYDTVCARLARGTAAAKLGISHDIVAPGKRSCPYHFHYAQEEAFVILQGEGTLRVAGEMLGIGIAEEFGQRIVDVGEVEVSIEDSDSVH